MLVYSRYWARHVDVGKMRREKRADVDEKALVSAVHLGGEVSTLLARVSSVDSPAVGEGERAG